MFEAVSTTKQRLAQTMRAFVRVLNRGLNGTGITAGTHDAGTDETGLAVVGGAMIGNVRKVSGVPVMTAKIPCTDGQSVSLIFHSPTADGAKLVSSDALVAFKFLLNKRDVTHVVAPIGGRDMSLDQTAQTLSNLIERNLPNSRNCKRRTAS
ncbi:internal head protein [Pantoea sp. LMR881]|uniref:defense against restriction DarA-related protein n=1 Tax=Pantoea sp. LMR881 TaxID=3014336 RepID=UPI0022B06796|nr:internal head protein [Pantoea sp. LMR881]MCZ4061352.1 internal head protein [Pantoea sp. LMR881]